MKKTVLSPLKSDFFDCNVSAQQRFENYMKTDVPKFEEENIPVWQRDDILSLCVGKMAESGISSTYDVKPK